MRTVWVGILIVLPAYLSAADATTPGQLTTPYPTLENLAVEWAIDGDDNLNGVVTVRYRKAGTSAWCDGLPLFRVPAGSNQGFSWANRHAGSILDLEPDTLYEIELVLEDPDGGSTSRNVTARTRPVPAASPNAVLRPVTPGTFSSAASSAEPGDILLLAAGSYSGFTFSRDGTIDDPIVIRGEQRDTVEVNGDVRLDGRDYVHVESLTVNGMIKFNGGQGIVVQRCTVRTTFSGIVGTGAGSVNAYIADNVVLGSSGWANETVGANGSNWGEGIEITGPGNVICYNHVKGFRDGISTMEDNWVVNQVCIDIYNNDIEIGADDGIEADFTQGNCRIMRNRITNSFVGLSSQPGLGGPTYFIRNVMYNIIYSPFKLHRASVGDIAFHNTVVKCGDAFRVPDTRTWSRAWFRNNLLIGGEGGGIYGGYGSGYGLVTDLPGAAPSCNFNFDGFGSIGTGRFEGRIGSNSFSSLDQMRSRTTETNAVEVDMSVFDEAVTFPSSGPFPERPIPDLSIQAGSAAVDRGEALPNVNDNYQGAAPDLGAYEAGDPLPHYGPRSRARPAAPTGLIVR